MSLLQINLNPFQNLSLPPPNSASVQSAVEAPPPAAQPTASPETPLPPPAVSAVTPVAPSPTPVPAPLSATSPKATKSMAPLHQNPFLPKSSGVQEPTLAQSPPSQSIGLPVARNASPSSAPSFWSQPAPSFQPERPQSALPPTPSKPLPPHEESPEGGLRSRSRPCVPSATQASKPLPSAPERPRIQRQSGRIHLPAMRADEPVVDDHGNPVVFFEVPRRAEKPKYMRSKRERPSGLVETIRGLPEELKGDIHRFQMENYVKHYFNQQRRGLFRRHVSPENLLEWSKDIQVSLLNTLRDEQAKEALELFRTIQMYMGDRPKPKKQSVDLARSLAATGVQQPELRDEIFCQLIKQVTLNPSVPSTVKGWELMAIMIDSFPCTKNLEPYVRSFLDESAILLDTSRVSMYAAYCLRRYDARWKNSTVMRVPSREEIQELQRNPFWGAMFGGTLDEIMQQQRERFPYVRLPRVVAIICDCILESGGERTEGIFRITAPMDDVYYTKVLLEKGCSELPPNDDAHVPACLLKTWFLELGEPIIPAEMYQRFIDQDGDLAGLGALVEAMPEVNRYTLLYLIRFLRIVAAPEHQKETRMTLENLALIFSPNLFRCPVENPMVQLKNTKIESSVLLCLLEHLPLPEAIPGVYLKSGSSVGDSQ